MKVVGDKSIFAFGYNIEEKAGKYVWGNFCLFINGRQVGYYNYSTTLSISISYLKDFISLGNVPYRWIPHSASKTKEELFSMIYERFFDKKPGDTADYRELSEYRNLFWLDEIGEDAFRDKLGIILVNEPEKSRQRIIWKYYKGNTVFEEFIPFGKFDEVSLVFIKEFEAEVGSISDGIVSN